MKKSVILYSVLLLLFSSLTFASCNDNQWDRAINYSKKAERIKKGLLSKFNKIYDICDSEPIHLNYFGKKYVLGKALEIRSLADDFDDVTEAYKKSAKKWKNLSIDCDDNRNARMAKKHSKKDSKARKKYAKYSGKLLKCASSLEDFYKPSKD